MYRTHIKTKKRTTVFEQRKQYSSTYLIRMFEYSVPALTKRAVGRRALCSGSNVIVTKRWPYVLNPVPLGFLLPLLLVPTPKISAGIACTRVTAEHLTRCSEFFLSEYQWCHRLAASNQETICNVHLSGFVPCTFSTICQIVIPPFQDCLTQRMHSIRPPKVFELQERARGPLSPCQIW